MELDCWAEKPTSPNYPLNWLLSGGHEETLRIRGTDGVRWGIESTDLCLRDHATSDLDASWDERDI